MVHLQGSLQDGGRAEHDQHHSPEVLPLGQLLQDAQEVDGGEQIAPAEAFVGGAALSNVGKLCVDRIEDTVREIQSGKVVPCGHVLAHVLVEELEHKGDAVGKDEVLAQIFKLVDVVDLKMLEQQQEGG